MTAHSESAQAVIQSFRSDPASGLTESQVQERRTRYGENRLREKKKKTKLQRFAEQFKNVMIHILILAAAISFVEGNAEGFFETVLILLIVVMDTVMGVVQEGRAEKALDVLKGLSAPYARMVRDGKEQVIDAAELVPGDVIRPAFASAVSSADLYAALLQRRPPRPAQSGGPAGASASNPVFAGVRGLPHLCGYRNPLSDAGGEKAGGAEGKGGGGCAGPPAV